MVGLAVVTAISVLVSSARSMINGQVAAAGKATFYVQATNTDAGLTPALATVLARQPGVRAVTEVRTTDATVAGAAHSSVDGVLPVPAGLCRLASHALPLVVPGTAAATLMAGHRTSNSHGAIGVVNSTSLT